MRWFSHVTNSVDVNLSEIRETVKDRVAWPATVLGIAELDVSLRPNNHP